MKRNRERKSVAIIIISIIFGLSLYLEIKLGVLGFSFFFFFGPLNHLAFIYIIILFLLLLLYQLYVRTQMVQSFKVMKLLGIYILWKKVQKTCYLWAIKCISFNVVVFVQTFLLNLLCTVCSILTLMLTKCFRVVSNTNCHHIPVYAAHLITMCVYVCVWECVYVCAIPCMTQMSFCVRF